MEFAAHVAAAGLDAHRYLSATHPVDVEVMEVVALRAREMRREDMVWAFREAWGGG